MRLGTYSLGKVMLFVAMILCLVRLCLAEEEDVSITTYYPSPFGSYNELEINRSITYKPINWIGITDPKEGELIYNVDKKFYYFNGTQWKALGEKQVFSITGQPTWTMVACPYACYYRKGSWSYSFTNPVDIVGLEVNGRLFIYSSSNPTNFTWDIIVTKQPGGLFHTIMSGRYDNWGPMWANDGSQIVYNESVLRSTLELGFKGTTSLRIEWDFCKGCTVFPVYGGWPCAGWPCSGGAYETVTVYYTPA